MEGFYTISCQVDEIEATDLLLSRYNNIEYVLNLDVVTGYKVYLKAVEKDIEKIIWERWLIDYRSMTKDNFISFEEYKKKFIISNTETNISKEDLLKRAEEIERKIEEKGRLENGT